MASGATTTIAAHIQPIATNAKAIVFAARHAVWFAETIGRFGDAIAVIAWIIEGVPEAHRVHPLSRFGDPINVIGRVAKACGVAHDLTSNLGAPTAIRAWASAMEHRVRWHRTRRPSAPSPPRIAIGDERTATGERSLTLDNREIANRGSLIATS